MRCTIVVACAMSLSASAFAGPSVPTVLYSDIVTSPTSLVPGLGGARFQGFDRIYRSPDGLLWIMSADTDLGTTVDEIIFSGSIPGATGSTVVQEGTTVLEGADTAGLIDRNLSINNAGQYAFATNHNGLTTEDEVIVLWDGAVFKYAGQEGDPVPGVAGENFGASLNASNIFADGTVAYSAPSTVGGFGTTQDDFLIAGNTVVAQAGVTIPSNQAGGATETWELFDFDDYYANSAGQYIALGDLTGATTGDDVVVVNGRVELQEDSLAPGQSSPISSIAEVYMSSSGDWMARGSNDDTNDWLVMNGSLIAQTGDPVPGGLLGEVFDDATFAAMFFSMVSDNNGNYVYGAVTSNADPLADAVLVYNNQSVIARQGDPVDLDGNGLFDDDAFINVFNNDDAFLTDSGEYWFTADLMNGAGTGIGQALIRLQVNVPGPAALALLGLGGLVARRRRR